MLFTGLRNQALTQLTVENIIRDQRLLHHKVEHINNKHKVQFFPIPPKLFNLLLEHIEANHLSPSDALLYGIKGQPLKNKQLNRITNKICEDLGWEKENKITPHGFRASIATLLDERGVGIDSIKYLLGHSNNENIRFYLRRDQRKINHLRKELMMIEEELENSLTLSNDTSITPQSALPSKADSPIY